MRTLLRLRQHILMTAEALAQADTHYTSSTDFDNCTGYVSLLVVAASAGAATITITQQCSLDGENWYDPVGPTGAAIGTVATALAVTTGTYITYSPVVAPYARFKVVEGNTAAVTVTITVTFQV